MNGMRGRVAQAIEQKGTTAMTNAETTTATSSTAVAEQGAHIGPEKPASKKGATRKKGAPSGPKAAKGAKPKKAASKKAAAKPAAERTNKKAEVVALMKRAKGVTLAEIMEATNWQAHTIRGFVSTLGSKGGERIESTKNAAGERTYKIAK